MITKLLTTLVMLGIGVITVLKLPRRIAQLMMYVPSWLQSLIIHFGYGGWIGGVTGHLLGGMLSIPWFFISEMWLRPRILGIARPKLNKLFLHNKKSVAV